MNDINVGDVMKQILFNQREILLGLSVIITPMCKGNTMDTNGETRCKNSRNANFKWELGE